MRIRSVTAHAFGALQGQRLDLAPGLTVVTGANESGKSTWHAACYAALCGRRRGSGATNDDKAFSGRHQPWSGASWRVSAVVDLDDGRRVQLDHDLAGRVDCRAIDLVTGADVSAEIMVDGSPDGSAWLGLDRRAFLATACVRQSDIVRVLDHADGLQAHLQRAAATSGGSETAAAALARLADFQRDQVGSTRTTSVKPLRRALDAVDSTRSALREARRTHEERSTLVERAAVARDRAEADAREVDRLGAAVHDASASGPAPDLEVHPSVAAALARHSEAARLADFHLRRRPIEPAPRAADVGQDIAAARARREQARDHLRATRAEESRLRSAAQPPVGGAPLARALTVVLVAAAIVVALAGQLPLAGLLAAAAVVAWTVGGRPRSPGGQPLSTAHARVGAAEADDAAAERALIEAEAMQSAAAATTVTHEQAVSEWHGQWEQLRAETLTAETALRQALIARGADQPGLSVEAAAAAYTEDCAHRRDDYERGLAAARVQAGHSAQAAAALEGALLQGARVVASVAEAEESLAAAETELARVQRLALVLETTAAFLTAAQERVHRDIAPVLAGSLSRWLPMVTDGRYVDAIVDPSTLEVQLCGHNRSWRPASGLSTGTAEQVYLLLRAALATHLTTSDEACPLLLDDVTVQADPQRTLAILDVLHQLSRERQVVLFAQQPTVADWAQTHLSADADRWVELPTLEVQ